MGGRTCNVAVDVPGTEDIGMVPTGTKCGSNKVSKKCVFCFLRTVIVSSNLKV